uniref:C40 family peptidase n=1 Tax=Nocardia sp. CY41 TaxID=2608686 RepID=UPI0019157770
GNATSSDTAAAINRLTKQYLYNIAGKNYKPPTGSTGANGATGAAAKAIQVALAQLGDPYVFGAEGPNAFDCSGLMQYAAAAAGVRIPRVAADQYRTLPKVNPRDIKPGDLIFPYPFRGPNNNPGHVIMYIGNGMCVEAPRTGGHVQYRKLPSSYAAARWT